MHYVDIEPEHEGEVQYHLGLYCFDRGGKLYLSGFTDEYCTNCDDDDVSGSSHLDSFEIATGKDIAYYSISFIDMMGFYCKEFADIVDSEWPG